MGHPDQKAFGLYRQPSFVLRFQLLLQELARDPQKRSSMRPHPTRGQAESHPARKMKSVETRAARPRRAAIFLVQCDSAFRSGAGLRQRCKQDSPDPFARETRACAGSAREADRTTRHARMPMSAEELPRAEKQESPACDRQVHA